MDETSESPIRRAMDIINEISAISDYKSPVKKQFCTLERRLKLLVPFFEEIRDSKDPIPDDLVKLLVSLSEALESAKELLKLGSEGSKIYLIIEKDIVMKKFNDVTELFEQALSTISLDRLDMSDEVKEQVELVLSQFRRAKGKTDACNDDIYDELVSFYNEEDDTSLDTAVLRTLTEKLQLNRIDDLMIESVALHEIVLSGGKDPGRNMEKMSMLLKKMNDFVRTENPDIEHATELSVSSGCGRSSPVIPDDFRCPISLELMKDPVIVSTGQTYERACIEKWIQEGHGTCPKTQQRLSSLTLTTNYVLRNLISQWCEANGMEPPKRPDRKPSTCSAAEKCRIEDLVTKLSSSNPEDLRHAAGEIRLLAKRNADNRIAIAEAGAIPLLVALLSTSDSRTQEHAVTALLNLSICDSNKGRIVASGSIPGIVHVLRRGSMEARENAAAALFSLSVIDEHKVAIGASGAIPPLVVLLSEGTARGKKDAATALFNLCIFQGNKGRAVRAGAVPTLMELMTEPGGGMVDEALAILAILAGHFEGRAAIAGADAVPVLVDVVRSGSPRNKENATAILVHLCAGDQQHLLRAQELGIIQPLVELAHNGNDRGKRKASQLLEQISRIDEQLKLPDQTETQSAIC